MDLQGADGRSLCAAAVLELEMSADGVLIRLLKGDEASSASAATAAAIPFRELLGARLSLSLLRQRDGKCLNLCRGSAVRPLDPNVTWAWALDVDTSAAAGLLPQALRSLFRPLAPGRFDRHLLRPQIRLVNVTFAGPAAEEGATGSDAGDSDSDSDLGSDSDSAEAGAGALAGRAAAEAAGLGRPNGRVPGGFDLPGSLQRSVLHLDISIGLERPATPAVLRPKAWETSRVSLALPGSTILELLEALGNWA